MQLYQFHSALIQYKQIKHTFILIINHKNSVYTHYDYI